MVDLAKESYVGMDSPQCYGLIQPEYLVLLIPVKKDQVSSLQVTCTSCLYLQMLDMDS